MRILFVAAGAALTLSACGGGGETQNNDMAVENLTVENLVLDDPAMGGTMNQDLNMGMDPSTQNMMMNDLTTNDADTNLANGI